MSSAGRQNITNSMTLLKTPRPVDRCCLPSSMLCPKSKLQTNDQAESGQDVTPNNMKSTQQRLKEEPARLVISKQQEKNHGSSGK